MKNKKLIIGIIMPIIVMLLILFLPLMKMEGTSNSILIFGFNLLSGIFDDSHNIIYDTNWISILFIFLPLTIIIFNLEKKEGVGKNIIYFLIMGAMFIYYLLLPLFAYKNLGDLYFGIYEFDYYFGIIITIILLGLNMIYYAYVSIKELMSIKQKDVENQTVSEEEYKSIINEGENR